MIHIKDVLDEILFEAGYKVDYPGWAYSQSNDSFLVLRHNLVIGYILLVNDRSAFVVNSNFVVNSKVGMISDYKVELCDPDSIAKLHARLIFLYYEFIKNLWDEVYRCCY